MLHPKFGQRVPTGDRCDRTSGHFRQLRAANDDALVARRLFLVELAPSALIEEPVDDGGIVRVRNGLDSGEAFVDVLLAIALDMFIAVDSHYFWVRVEPTFLQVFNRYH